MELIPDWAPNVHPMVVHFPIAFVAGALGADLLSLVVRRWTWLRPATVALYGVAGVNADPGLAMGKGGWQWQPQSRKHSGRLHLLEHMRASPSGPAASWTSSTAQCTGSWVCTRPAGRFRTSRRLEGLLTRSPL